MEVKEWSYKEYPSFDTPVDGVVRIPTSGDEKGTYIYSNVEYAHIDGTTLHLQIITPQTRNKKESEEVYHCKMCSKMKFYTDIINMKILVGKIYRK